MDRIPLPTGHPQPQMAQVLRKRLNLGTCRILYTGLVRIARGFAVCLTGSVRTFAENDAEDTMPKAVYRSALRSKRLLREAFSQLLQEKDYNRITVTEVVNRADLNRSTFYAHYTGIEDMIRELTDEVTAGLMSILQQAFAGDFFRHPEPTLELLGSLLLENRELYRSLSIARQADAFIEDLRRVLTERIQKELETPLSAERAGLIAFVSGGVVALYRAWLDGICGDVAVDAVNAQAAAYVKAAGAAAE